MTRQKNCLPANFRSQEGIVLLVGLIVVLLMTIIALAAIRGSGLQEAMAGNMRDRNLAFQAAESGLAWGERNVALKVAVAPVCDGLDHGGVICWENLELNSVGSANYFEKKADFLAKGVLAVLGLTKVKEQPIYVQEELATFSPNDGSGLDESGVTNITKLTPYRTTARGVGITQDSVVVVQSTFNRSAH